MLPPKKEAPVTFLPRPNETRECPIDTTTRWQLFYVDISIPQGLEKSKGENAFFAFLLKK
jgi:hypothetical protein